jgi:hypothetical protein
MLTGSGNRRRLVTDLDRALLKGAVSAAARDLRPRRLQVYNDTFGRPAGDALLAASRLSWMRSPLPSALPIASAVTSSAPSWTWLARCRIVPRRGRAQAGWRRVHCHELLWRRLTARRRDVSDALRVADQRLYVQKRERSAAVRWVLLQAL